MAKIKVAINGFGRMASMGAEKIIPKVFGLIDTPRIEEHLQREALRRRAVPKSVQGRYSFARTGLQQYGQMMNFDAVAKSREGEK
jgi:glyceraldehyde-3-phosphate dehydrogenase/erythrose-4-phosphate dehydrogenase